MPAVIGDSLTPGFIGNLSWMRYQAGGVHVVMTNAQRNAIPALVRTLDATETTVVYVQSTNKWWRLDTNPVGDTTIDSNWVSLNFSSLSGPISLGNWDPTIPNPVLHDADAADINGQFYFVIGAGNGYSFHADDMLAGFTTTVFNGDWLMSIGTRWAIVPGPNRPSSFRFTDLLDVPSTYLGAADKLVVVKHDATGLTFAASSALTTLVSGNGTTWNNTTKAVDLGGTLTANVAIDGAFNVRFGDTTVPLSIFDVVAGNVGYTQFSKALLNTSSVDLFHVESSSTIAEVLLNSTGVHITGGIGGASPHTSIDLTGTTAIFTDTRVTTLALQYAADYSSGFTARSLVDKGYVVGAKTFTGTQTLATATTGLMPLVIPHGVAPTGGALVDGGIWTTTAGLFARINGVTQAYGVGGGGTVTSMSTGNLSPLFTAAIATATTTPALSFTLSTQTANTVFAGPATGGAAAPTFRTLVAADVPTLSYWPLGSSATLTGNVFIDGTFSSYSINIGGGFLNPVGTFNVTAYSLAKMDISGGGTSIRVENFGVTLQASGSAGIFFDDGFLPTVDGYVWTAVGTLGYGHWAPSTAGGAVSYTLNAQSSNYTFSLTDATIQTLVQATSASATNFTIPPNSSVAYGPGAVLSLVWDGAGQPTWVAGAGVTIHSSSGSLVMPARYTTAVAIQTAVTDTWYLLNGMPGNPFADNIALVANAADNTKLLLLSAASISTATTRTWTFPDVNGTVARNDAAQTFSGVQTFTTEVLITQAAMSSSWVSAFKVTPGGHTLLTAATEFVSSDFAAFTWSWNSGTTTTQRFRYFRSPTINSTSGTATFTDLYNVYIDPVILGTTAVATNNWALGLGGGLKLFAGTTTRPALVLPTGVNLTTTQAGALENDGTHLYFTFANSGTRFQLDQQSGISALTTGTMPYATSLTTIGDSEITRSNSSVYVLNGNINGQSSFTVFNAATGNANSAVLIVTTQNGGDTGALAVNGSSNSTNPSVVTLSNSAGHIYLLANGGNVGVNIATPSTTFQVRGVSSVLIGQTTSTYGKTGGMIADHFVNAGNTTTTETDLYSDTTPASSLGTNGDKICAEYGGSFVSSATATRQIRIYFAGTAIFDSGALTVSLSSKWTCYVTVTRVSSTVVRYMISMTTEGAALAAYTSVGELTGLTLSNTNILKITGQAASTGAATNDIVATMGYVEWKPAA